jgi:hypothetical protein
LPLSNKLTLCAFCVVISRGRRTHRAATTSRVL